MFLSCLYRGMSSDSQSGTSLQFKRVFFQTSQRQNAKNNGLLSSARVTYLSSFIGTFLCARDVYCLPVSSKSQRPKLSVGPPPLPDSTTFRIPESQNRVRFEIFIKRKAARNDPSASVVFFFHGEMRDKGKMPARCGVSESQPI